MFRATVTLVLAAVGAIIIQVQVMPALGDPFFTMSVNILFILCSLFLLSAFGQVSFRRALGLEGKSSRYMKVQSCALGLAFGGVVSGMAATLRPESYAATCEVAAQMPRAYMFLGVFAVLVIPVMEETIFRGVIFGAYQRRSSTVVAVLVSSLLFMLAHAQYAGDAPLMGLMFLLGIVFCVLRILSNSIVPGLLMHCAYNAVVTMYPALEA